jgi:hypothetical protein
MFVSNTARQVITTVLPKYHPGNSCSNFPSKPSPVKMVSDSNVILTYLVSSTVQCITADASSEAISVFNRCVK